MQVATNEWKRFEIEERKAPIAFTNIRRDFFQLNICYLQGSVHILLHREFLTQPRIGIFG